MTDQFALSVAAFVLAGGVIVVFSLLIGGGQQSLSRRIREMNERGLPIGRSGTAANDEESILFRAADAVATADPERREKASKQLIRAGLYKPSAVVYLNGIKLLMFLLPVGAGFLVGGSGVTTMRNGLLFGCITGALGTIAPSFILDYRRSKRETNLRRALPDALDIIIVCLEGGLSLPASFARVGSELRSVHPLLGDEMAIVQREIQLGRSTGEALSKMAERFNVEELRSMAMVIVQAERFGASVVKALRVYSDTLRMKRMQWAEEKAQKASVKILFPLILCIFPAVFIVLVGPAAIDIIRLMRTLNG